MFNHINRIITALRGIKVTVQWEGTRVMHKASCWSDALAWAECYPIDASVTITQHGKHLASRSPNTLSN